MGGFINTTYFDTHDKIGGLAEDLLKNPFYLFNDKKATKVKYYNINTEKSTLDPGSKISYADLGHNSPIRYNLIYDVYIYQFQKLELNFNDDEFGMENDPIEGESYILPNQFTPMEGDFFEVAQVKGRTLLFKVITSQIDTLENGNNVYKINWKLDRSSNKEILDNVVDKFHYVNVQQGTNLKAIVQEDKYQIAKKLDDLSITVAEYFVEMFYSNNVQTFIYKWYTEHNMYDPFAIEFIRRNRLLKPIESKVYVSHQMKLPQTFSLDYNRSFFRAVELKDKERLYNSQYKSQADFIDDMSSIFYSRYEDYYALNYKVVAEENGPLNPRGIILALDDDLVQHICSNCKYEVGDDREYLNIIIQYFNNERLNPDILIHNLELSSFLNNTDIMDEEIFYELLLILYCIDQEIALLLS